MYPTTEDVRRSQQLQTQTNLVDVSSRLDEIKHRIQRVQQQQQTQQLLQKQQLDQQGKFSLSFISYFRTDLELLTWFE